jgi:FHS family Na+ dependent glucose MFS transporter 1
MNPKRVGPRMLTAAYYLSFIILGLSTAAEGPSLPKLAAHTSSPLNQISLMFVVGAFGYLLGSLIGGRAYDRLPKHRFMACTLIIMIVSAIVFPIASSLWVLLSAAFAMGLGKGALDVGCNILLQWVHGKGVAPLMNGLHFSFGLGAFLSPILLAQVISITREIYWVFWIIALLMIPLAIWLWFLPAPPVHIHTETSDHLLSSVTPILLIVLAFVLYVGAEVGFSNWIYTYALTLNLATTVTAAYLTSAFWGLFTIGRLLGVWVSTRARSRTILFADFAGCFVSLALILVRRDSAILLWIGTICFGLSMASIFPTILTLAAESLRITGAITGWFLVGAGAGGMFLPWLIGQAFTSSGPQMMMVIVLVDIILNLLTLLFFMYQRRPSLAAASQT